MYLELELLEPILKSLFQERIDNMSAKNRVLSGDYAGKQILGGGVSQAGISIGFVKQLYLNKTTVESYEVINNENQKSMASGVARGIVGGALLGGVGAIAGAASAKNKGIYTIAIQFKDGKRSLIEVDDKIYKAIVQNCF